MSSLKEERRRGRRGGGGAREGKGREEERKGDKDKEKNVSRDLCGSLSTDVPPVKAAPCCGTCC